MVETTKEFLINKDELGYNDKIGKEIEIYLTSGKSLTGILKGADKKALIIGTKTDEYTEEVLINTAKIKYIKVLEAKPESDKNEIALGKVGKILVLICVGICVGLLVTFFVTVAMLASSVF